MHKNQVVVVLDKSVNEFYGKRRFIELINAINVSEIVPPYLSNHICISKYVLGGVCSAETIPSLNLFLHTTPVG